MTAPHEPQPSADERIEQFRQLLAQVKEGSEEAAWTLVQSYGRTIERAVRFLIDDRLRKRFDPEDFAQAVWLSFFRHRSQIAEFTHPNELVAFLSQTALHKVVDQRRRNFAAKRSAKGNQDENADRPESIPGRDPTPSQFAVARERWENMLAHQPEVSRRVLRLRFLGHSRMEIAETLKLHERTVRKILDGVDEDWNRDSP